MNTNNAAWLMNRQENLTVGTAPKPAPQDHELVVRNRAVAINPVDWMKQRAGDFMFSFVKYPFILGSDLAGEVVAVGRLIARFKVGDRVLAHALGMTKERNRAAEGAFQEYTVVLEHMTSAIPDSLSFEDAAVLPLGLSTAACGLFQHDQLALQLPSAVTAKQQDQTVLIWGGSTSVGSNAIQLAVAAGYNVVTTASPNNSQYCRKLGASEVFDYSSPTVVQQIVKALAAKTLAGALAIGDGSADGCLEVVHRCPGRKFVSIVTFPVAFRELPDRAGRWTTMVHVIPQMLRGGLTILRKSRPRSIRTGVVFATSIAQSELSRVIYRDYLPKALAEGHYTAAPPPLVVGKDLGCVQAGLDLQRRGVSASKVVVSL